MKIDGDQFTLADSLVTDGSGWLGGGPAVLLQNRPSLVPLESIYTSTISPNSSKANNG